MAQYPYEVRIAPGCYSGPEAPLVSQHVTLEEAVAVARRSNRLVVELSTAHGTVWRATQYRRSRHGDGLYGQPDVRPLRECVREAYQALAEVQS